MSTSVSVQTQVDIGLVFYMELEFARTRCRKFDEGIGNCPFQATPDVNNVRHTPATLRLQGRGHCIRAGGVGSDDDAFAKSTEGSSAAWRPARQASPGVTGDLYAPGLSTHWSHFCCCIPGPPRVRLFLTTWSRPLGRR